MILLMKSVKSILGHNIKSYRKRIGLTQGGLSARVGISKSTITLIESGKVWPEFQNIEAIAKVLGVEHRLLFVDGSSKPIAVKPTPPEALKIITEIVEKSMQPKSDNEK